MSLDLGRLDGAHTGMVRTMCSELLNRVVNHPDVRPAVGGVGNLDLTQLVGNPDNIALVNDFGGFIGVKHEQGIYECHTLFLPEYRGTKAFAAAREAASFMFTKTDCLEILTKVPLSNRPAAMMVRHLGYIERFSRKSAFNGPAGQCDVRYFAYSIDQWMADDVALPFIGHQFHDQMEAAKDRHRSALLTHDEDEAHDRAVGAAASMLTAGNAVKAVWFYNRWARFAEYQTIELLSTNPIVVDVRDAVLQISDNGMEVLKCR
ncbi:hypothetical protein [Asticcacaulis benevestitus]|nr:hypothetical protein [Asticcacaulis benevestitus]